VVLKATPDYEASPDEAPSASGAAPPRTEPDDPKFSQQWAYDDFDDHDVDAPEAWSLQTGRSDVTVAVVDGGVDLDHPDLDPGDRSRVIQGYDFGDDDNDPDDDRSSGDWTDHGTPVAGTIGARTDNNEGVAGLMWDLQIMPLKIVESNKTGSAPFSNVAEAFDYARSNGADVINYSGSSTLPSSDGVVAEAAYNAYASGMIVVGSSGNDSKSSVNYPAALHTTIGVGATDQGDSRRGSSNYGSRLDIVAPSVFETTSRGLNGDLYDGFSGTSQSAPVVSGIAGLILSESRDRNLGLTNDDVQHLMEQTADNVDPMNGDFDPEYGHGRVNARKALEALQPPNEVTHGTASFTKIQNDDRVSFPNGFAKENGTFYGAGTYECDIYELSASASSPDFYYEEKPWFWLPVTEKGFSAASPNDGDRYLSKSVSKNSAQATTYFYYVESNVNGQDIGWVPFDPTVHKRNGSFEYTAIGKPDTAPLEVSLTGPTSLNAGQEGTWTADVSGGEGSPSYDWEYRPAGSSTWYDENCGGSTCSRTFYGGDYENGGVRATVTKGAESETATTTVFITPNCQGDRICLKTPGRTVAIQAPDVQPRPDRTAALTWSASARPPVSHFEVEHRVDSTGTWSPLGTVPVGDSVRTDSTGPAYRFETDDLEVGTHQFRLAFEPSGQAKAQDWTSEPTTARIELGRPYQLSTSPNPARQQATVELAVKERQPVTIRLYDVLGRQVETLHRGPVPAHTDRRLRVDISEMELSSGTYFLRARGETFAATTKLTVAR